MLICALRTQVKEFKIELSNKFYIEKITFETFKTLNVQFQKKNKNSTFDSLSYGRAQVSIIQ